MHEWKKKFSTHSSEEHNNCFLTTSEEKMFFSVHGAKTDFSSAVVAVEGWFLSMSEGNIFSTHLWRKNMGTQYYCFSCTSEKKIFHFLVNHTLRRIHCERCNTQFVRKCIFTIHAIIIMVKTHFLSQIIISQQIVLGLQVANEVSVFKWCNISKHERSEN